MADGFSGTGLSAGLVGAVEQLGFENPTALQRAAIPVLRRGGNLVLHASSGAGITLAYGLPVLERVGAEGTGLRGLIVTPTEERASEVAHALGRLGNAVGARVTALAPAWAATDAAVAVVTVGRLLPMLRASQLKLEDVIVLVIDGMSSMLSLGGSEALETLFTSTPKEAQRVITTGELTEPVGRLIDAHVRKPMHIPPRPANPAEVQPVATAGTLRYTVMGDRSGHSMLATLLADEGDDRVIYCRTMDAASEVEEVIGLHGLKARVRVYGERSGENQAIGFGAPFDADTLKDTLRNDDVVLVTAAELPHLRRIAQQAHYELKHHSPAVAKQSPLDRFRETIVDAMAEEDIEAQMLVIEPLLELYSAAEIAAAAVALLRKRTLRAAASAPESQATAGAAPSPAFVKLFLGVGAKDGISPRDIVGAITGEANISGDQVGKVEIRDMFSVVEVDATAADKVIRALNGTSLRGRSLRVDYDRKGASPKRTVRPPRRVQRPERS